MQAFSKLYQTLDQTTSTNAKVAAMVVYFGEAAPADAAWAVYFLSGRRIKRLVGAALLRQWLTELADLPNWLVEDTYASVGDLAETVALLVARPDDFQGTLTRPAERPPTVDTSLECATGTETHAGSSAYTQTDHDPHSHDIGLADWVENRLLPLRKLDTDAQRTVVTGWWQSQPYEQCYIITKLLTGALRVGVSQTLLARALAERAELERAVILHRLMGEWQPDAAYYEALIAQDDGAAATSRPYPFCLAAPLENEPETLGDSGAWLAEWKWDGIRAQLIRRQDEIYLWSRGEELIGQRFPEVVAAAHGLPDGTVLDGELLPWNDDGVMGFAALQRRIGRKTVGRKLLDEVPCVLLCYDLLELGGRDVRTETLRWRRQALEAMIATQPAGLRVSEVVAASGWAAMAELRASSRERLVEGLMLKALESPYGTGRKRGLWWKWKIEPYTVDAVMLYAQAGHGRRSNLFTDYTFAVWQDNKLVPIAKAYSGLDNQEINRLDKWIRRNTLERFGPVRSVKPEQVFELAFEGINVSTRHKSGIAVRFPRIVRWREDLAPKDADTLKDVKRLIGAADE